jgi:acyl transferase domain-containing protein
MAENHKHGSDKEAEADDPMELIGTPAPGDPAFMLRCFVEEYVRMGKSREQLLSIFQNSFYESANALLERYGRETVEAMIDEVLDDHAGYEYETNVAQPQPNSPQSSEEGDDNG